MLLHCPCTCGNHTGLPHSVTRHWECHPPPSKLLFLTEYLRSLSSTSSPDHPCGYLSAIVVTYSHETGASWAVPQVSCIPRASKPPANRRATQLFRIGEVSAFIRCHWRWLTTDRGHQATSSLYVAIDNKVTQVPNPDGSPPVNPPAPPSAQSL